MVIRCRNVAGMEVLDVGVDVGVEVDLASVICSLLENMRLRGRILEKWPDNECFSIYPGMQ